MLNPPNQTNTQNSKDTDTDFFAAPPAVSLPRGGGAIKGMGEKFAANPVTGTGSMSVPIATSPGRRGFGPQLALTYDSGTGNGAFGLGWNLSTPAITRKTDKGLPRYRDAEESDVFILSGAEDLVPVLTADGTIDETRRDRYQIHKYRPRIEGLFARIERWTEIESGEVHWRSISRDNITTLYGKTAESRIADPENPTHIFSWLICESYDDKGNAIRYEYKAEDSDGVDTSQVHERNRTLESRSANRYLKRIHYGNRVSRLVQPDLEAMDWLFEAVFDYGEHDLVNPAPDDSELWPVRNDPFSAYRAGFEVRTYRLCQRVLMFHHFPEGLNGADGYDGLVRSTDFTYSYEVNPTDAHNPIYSRLLSATQTGYKRNSEGDYARKSLPPLEFTYSEPLIDEAVRDVDRTNLENLPEGLDGGRYQWVDLDGEGLSGILTEQAEGWFYKRNLSPANPDQSNGSESTQERVAACFAGLESVARKPLMTLADGGQFLDLAGDGQLDLVSLHDTTPGFYERTHKEDWEAFVPFKSLPVLDWSNPNLKFIDLNGDGHSDILITEDECFVWHPSLAEEGFGAAQRSHQPWDEEKGPRIIFADGTQSIYLADLSGDGLTDIARIRNGEVCYWPNLGYGRFGTKVTMDRAPWFDAPDIFDQRRIVLADIDGSGTTDILYLSQAGVQVYFNQSGNRWAPKQVLTSFPAIDNMASVTVVDLLGNGTACLVWSSSLPGNGDRVMRYIDLMGGQKPHLLIKTVNNLGAETTVQYAPSTKFYVQDKLAGQPWITKIPFPVHVVEKVTVTDKWRQTTFSTTYSYHHGYFDGIEREFRGFGRVEQVDVESYGAFERGNPESPYITDDKTLYQPPMKTVTWHHTGVMVNRDHILSQYEQEYFPHWFEAQNPDATNVLGSFQENSLPEPDLDIANLTAAEWREALRACKGMMLRQEVYELDVDALEMGEEKPVKLYSTAYHNCHIQKLQSRGINQYGIFLVTESEAITYHYELDLTQTSLEPDPRIAHTLNLAIDEYGNVLESVAVAYPRLKAYSDATLPAGTDGLITQVQQERHLVYTENTFTNDVEEADHYRLRLPCEVKTYELTGINPAFGIYFTLADLRTAAVRETVSEIPYHVIPNHTTPQKRRVEQVRMLYFSEDLQMPLPWGELNALGLPYETYKLALTDGLLTAIFEPEKLTPQVRNELDTDVVSGYLSGATLTARFPDIGATSGQYWVRSGIAGFATDAADHFYLPEHYTDLFDQVTTLAYDPLDLFVQTSTDPVGNTATVTRFDYRVLAPLEMQDPNDNCSEVVFDVLGMPTAMAVKGKGTEGDSLETLTDDLLNLDTVTRNNFFTSSFDAAEARRLLDQSTARHIYYFGEEEVDGILRYGQHPPCAAAILREQHVADLEPGQTSPLQVAFEYSDGSGTALVTKAQAEPETPDGPQRWVANGKTILNNKGKPVKQYEPYFTDSHTFAEPVEVGVTPVMYYDAIGRLIRTEAPDGSVSRVEFSPWQVTSYDPNDTVLEPGNGWYANHTEAAASAADQRAAQLAADHADTPAKVFLDSLGREVISVAHNRVKDTQGALQDEQYVTFTKLDIEGKPLWIRDDRGNLVMQYIVPAKPTHGDDETIPTGTVPCYDIAGNLLCQHSMDAGTRWMLNNATGNPLRSWDSRRHQMRYEYDELQRPTHVYVQPGSEPEFLAEQTVYGESVADPATTNHRGQVYQVFDSAGVVTSIEYDFKGNLRQSQRQLLTDYKTQVDWSAEPALEATIFTASTKYDALNRPALLTSPDQSETRPVYNEANLLEQMQVRRRGAETETIFVQNIDYDAKGQRTLIEYSNGVQTTYSYDDETFRLVRLLTTRGDGGSPLQDLRYTYDPVGNITEIRDEAQQTIYFNGEVVAAHSRYTYDALYRLIAAQGREHVGQNANNQPHHRSELKPHYDFNDITRRNLAHPHNGQAMRNYTQQYAYDSVGNILAMGHQAGEDGWQRAYEYATDSNRLLRTSLPASGNTPQWGTYTYDTHGSMTQMPHLPLMRWDYKDQMQASARQVVNNGGTPETTYYVYDASGERVRKVTERQTAGGEPPTRRNERIYLGGYEIYREYSGDGTTATLERETLHVMDNQQRIALVETKTIDTKNSSETALLAPIIRYQLGNHLGSVSLELDADGAVISYEEYHPYGTTAYQAGRSAAEVGLKRYRYTGKERDEETGLSYHGARYYAPWLGRWTIVDPAGLVDGTNLYAYSLLNPVGYRDSSGTTAKQPPPIRSGMFIGESNVFELWKKAANGVLQRKFKNQLSYEDNLKIFSEEISNLEKQFGGKGSNTKKGTATYTARRTFKNARRQFGRYLKNAGVSTDFLKGMQVHHAFDHLAEFPQKALDGGFLQIAHGNASDLTQTHGISTAVENELHELLNTGKSINGRNPGMEVLEKTIKEAKSTNDPKVVKRLSETLKSIGKTGMLGGLSSLLSVGKVASKFLGPVGDGLDVTISTVEIAEAETPGEKLDAYSDAALGTGVGLIPHPLTQTFSITYTLTDEYIAPAIDNHTSYFKSAVKAANETEQEVTEFTGSETAGKVAGVATAAYRSVNPVPFLTEKATDFLGSLF